MVRQFFPLFVDMSNLLLQDECQNYVRVLLVNGRTLFTCGTNAFTPVCVTRQVGTKAYHNMFPIWFVSLNKNVSKEPIKALQQRQVLFVLFVLFLFSVRLLTSVRHWTQWTVLLDVPMTRVTTPLPWWRRGASYMLLRWSISLDVTRSSIEVWGTCRLCERLSTTPSGSMVNKALE